MSIQIHITNPHSIVSTARQYQEGAIDVDGLVLTRLAQPDLVPSVPPPGTRVRLVYLRVGSHGDFLDAALVSRAIELGWKSIAVITNLTDFPMGEVASGGGVYPRWVHLDEAVSTASTVIMGDGGVLVIAPGAFVHSHPQVALFSLPGVEVVESTADASRGSYSLVIDCGLETTYRRPAGEREDDEGNLGPYELRYRLISDQESVRGSTIVATGGEVILVDDLLEAATNEDDAPSGVAMVGAQRIVTPPMAVEYVIARMAEEGGLGNENTYKRALTRPEWEDLEQVYASLDYPTRTIVARVGRLVGLHGARFIHSWKQQYNPRGYDAMMFPGIVVAASLAQVGTAVGVSDPLTKWLELWEQHASTELASSLETAPPQGVLTTAGVSEPDWDRFQSAITATMEALGAPYYARFSAKGALQRATAILRKIYNVWDPDVDEVLVVTDLRSPDGAVAVSIPLVDTSEDDLLDLPPIDADIIRELQVQWKHVDRPNRVPIVPVGGSGR